MGKTTFRKMTTDDVDALVELDFKSFGNEAWSREDFLDMAQIEEAEFIVAERDGKIIACAGAVIDSDAAEIQTFAVAPEFRRQGIGLMLFVQLILAIKRRGTTFIFLEVRPSNTAAIKLYEGFDFKTVDRVKNFYGNEDALIMVRDFA